MQDDSPNGRDASSMSTRSEVATPVFLGGPARHGMGQPPLLPGAAGIFDAALREARKVNANAVTNRFVAGKTADGMRSCARGVSGEKHQLSRVTRLLSALLRRF